MTDLPKFEISHIGIFVRDMARMREFYTGLLGFRVTDNGTMRNGQELTFMSRDPRDHHQIVLVSGREERGASTINQITFRVGTLAEVRTMHDRLVAHEADRIDPVDHGNAWSVYFHDPEGNRLEVFCDTPWYVKQPRREPLDFSLSDEEIEKLTYERIKDDPSTRPFDEWRRTIAKEMAPAE